MSGVSGRPWPSVRAIAAGLAVAAVAAAGGWVIADKIAASGDAPAADPAKVLTAGPARLRVTGSWTRAPRAPALPGMAEAPAFAPYAGLATTVSVALLPADTAALVPAALVDAARGGLPTAETARVVGLRARAYRGVRAGDSVLDVYAIPTTRGVLTLVCAARDGGAEAPTWCLEGLDRVTVEGARPVALDASTAYRMRAPDAFAALDSVRVEQRVALRRAKGPIGQRRAAQALWRAYRDAASELAPLAPSGSSPAAVVAALRSTARAYRALGVAANRHSVRGWSRARTSVANAERALRVALDAT